MSRDRGKWASGGPTVFSVIVDQAAEPSLTIADVDAAIDALARSEGPGSAAARQAGIAGLLGRATPDEAEFLRRLLVGELRQGALAGVMTDAVARASGLSLSAVRRAAMLRVTCRGWPAGPRRRIGRTGPRRSHAAAPRLSDAGVTLGGGHGGHRGPGPVVGGVEAGRCPHPGPPPRRRGARRSPLISR